MLLSAARLVRFGSVPATLSFLIALGGLVLAGLSLYFSYRERTASYRLRLYDKQVDAQTELMASLAALYQDTIIEVYQTHPRGPITRQYLSNQIGPKWNALLQLRDMWSFVLAQEVITALDGYGIAQQAITGSDEQASESPAKGDLEPLIKAYEHVVETMRESVGTSVLDAQTARVLGHPRAQ